MFKRLWKILTGVSDKEVLIASLLEENATLHARAEKAETETSTALQALANGAHKDGRAGNTILVYRFPSEEAADAFIKRNAETANV